MTALVVNGKHERISAGQGADPIDHQYHDLTSLDAGPPLDPLLQPLGVGVLVAFLVGILNLLRVK